MPVSWNAEQVIALAPDASSAKSGKELSAARKWKTLGATEACAWGEIQGSGKNPYQTCIDLSEPAFKCTCPSRKFPCKHGLGLFLILTQQPNALAGKEAPGWAAEWLAKRVKRAEKKEPDAAASGPPDPEAEAKAAAAAEKRVAARESKVEAGLRDLDVWLKDLVRSGFASLPGKPSSFWETPAARLVDAQARGLARWVRDLDGITTTGEAWPGRLLGKLGLIHLACEGWSRLKTLPPDTQADLRSVLGFTEKQEEILALEGVRDQWIVLGQRIEEEELVRVQRTWLFGTAGGRFALCLSFAAMNQRLDISLVPGTVVDADLAFFPGSSMRALVKQRHGEPAQMPHPKFPHGTISDANAFASNSFIANPWLERVPVALAKALTVRRDQGWLARDEAGEILPLSVNEDQGWRLVAMGGGHPMGMAGEWDGEMLRPLSAWAEGRFLRI